MKKARALKAEEILTTAETTPVEVNNNVEIEDIGPEPDIFDEVVNNPDLYTEKQIEDNVTEEAEMPEDPMEKAIRTNDPYVNVEILPGPSNPTQYEPTPGPSGYNQEAIYPAKPSDQLDLGFVLALANDPYKALEIARNVKEVNQATEAIDALEAVSQVDNILDTYLKKNLVLKKPLRRTSTKTRNLIPTKNLLPTARNLTTLTTLFNPQARRRPSASSTDWAEQVELAELQALKEARKQAIKRTKGKLQPDPKAKESGFIPSSARKNNGRGAKNSRGATRGRGSTRGTRGSARGGARGGAKNTPKTTRTTSKAKVSEIFNPDEAGNDTDESEIDDTLPIMSQIRHALAKTSKNSGMAPDGNVTVLNQTIKDGDARAPDPVQAPNYTIQDLMPEGMQDEVDRNHDMVANLPAKQNLIEFALIQRCWEVKANGKAKGVGVPAYQTFKDLIVDAIMLTVREEPAWCNVVHSDFMTKHGIAVVVLDYGYPEGAERFRSNVIALSPSNIEYNTYPAADLLKKYAVTVFFHQGFKRYPLELLGPGLKGGNADMKGDFTVVDSSCLLYTSPSPRDRQKSRMPSSA